MRAARFHGKQQLGHLSLDVVPVPQPGPGEALVQVRYCGICGTDTHIVQGLPGSLPVVGPRTLGHEFSGRVAAVGDGVGHLEIGQRVTSDVNFSCGHCAACYRGNPHLCPDMLGVGTAIDGAFADYIVVPAAACHPIPDQVSDEQAALVEPLSCCLHGMDRLSVRLGDTVAIIGAGTIGLIMVQLARQAGAVHITAVEPHPHQRQLALQLGANQAVDPSHVEGAWDKVIDCAGTPDSAALALRLAARGATVVFFGLTRPDDEIGLRPYEVFQKELTITSSFVNPHTFGRALSLLASGGIRTSALITRVLPLDHINDAFGQPHPGKTLVEVSAADDRSNP
jgi:2-desacetyl-2-hydroxyethyl bacteriochlorophyllide A dehydrogenase